jgi:hypothetical protein
MRRNRCSGLLAALLISVFAPVAHSEVHVEGNKTAVRVTTDRDKIADVLAAFSTIFGVKYRSAVSLDSPANITYAGSFEQVVSRLLEGYSYVLKHEHDTTEIVVFGKRGEAAIAPPALNTRRGPPAVAPPAGQPNADGMIERMPEGAQSSRSKTITEPWGR